MYRKLLLILLFSATSYAQDIKNILYKAYISEDSSDYYFKIAKSKIKTTSDEGQYYFCKTAKFSSNLDSVQFYGNLAIKKLSEVKDYPSLLTVYSNIALAYQKRGIFEKSILYKQIGLKKSEELKNTSYEAFFCFGLSEAYHDFESYEKGVAYGKRAYKLNLQENPRSNIRIKNSLNSIAINYDDWNKPELALKYHFKVFDYIRGKDTLAIHSTYNNIGNTLLKQKKYAEAAKWINRGLVILDANPKKVIDKYYYGSKSTIYVNLATIAYNLNDFTKAEELFQKARNFTFKSTDAVKKRDYFMHLALFNKKRNNLEGVIKSQEQYLKLRDSVFEVKRAKSVAEIEIKYQTEKRKKELLLAKYKLFEEELQHKKKTSWLYVISIFAFFSILFAYLYSRQQKIKNTQQIQEFELKSAILKMEGQNELQEQRLSISRDLHDNIGAQLTFIISAVENIKHGFKIENQKLLEKLNTISNFSKNTIVELRDTIWALNHEEISFEELHGRVNNFIEDAQSLYANCIFSFSIDECLGDKRLSSIQGVNLYRTIQEAINNALKYSEATKISVCIKQVGAQVKIEINDNGVGFDIPNVVHGNGLKNMKKRIREIKGLFSITSTDRGTTVTILI